jgi:hypothetical protein
MDTGKKIPGDRLVLGLLSAFRTLVMELSKNGALDLNGFVHVLQQTAEAHRETGDPNRIADAITRSVCRLRLPYRGRIPTRINESGACGLLQQPCLFHWSLYIYAYGLAFGGRQWSVNCPKAHHA